MAIVDHTKMTTAQLKKSFKDNSYPCFVNEQFEFPKRLVRTCFSHYSSSVYTSEWQPFFKRPFSADSILKPVFLTALTPAKHLRQLLSLLCTFEQFESLKRLVRTFFSHCSSSVYMSEWQPFFKRLFSTDSIIKLVF